MEQLTRQTSSISSDAPTVARDVALDLADRGRNRPFVRLRRNRLLRSGITSAIRPIFKALGIFLIALGAAWLIPSLIDSISQRTLHRAGVHPDRSFVKTGVVRNFANPTTLVYRDRNGTRHLILADEIGLNRFINDTLVYLDSQRDAIKSNTDRQIKALLESALADGSECISRYADWYFEWGRSWYLLKEGAVGGAKGLLPNNVQGFSEASRNEVEAYLLRNFQRLVLKPELRNSIIESGVASILAEAHARYLDALTEIDERLQVFLRTDTRHLEVIDDHSPSNVSLDWDAQKWKAPRYSVDDEAFRATFRAVSMITISGLIAKTIGPAVERAIAQAFTAAANRIVTSLYPQLLGFAAGSVAEPGVGSLAGLLVGTGGALIIDYVLNRRNERLGRAELEATSLEALNTTKVEYSRAIQRDLAQAVDIWFDDTRAIVAEQLIVRKDGPKS
jgi:hypothetical protein